MELEGAAGDLGRRRGVYRRLEGRRADEGQGVTIPITFDSPPTWDQRISLELHVGDRSDVILGLAFAALRGIGENATPS